jgi:biopolymer transport protein ExbB
MYPLAACSLIALAGRGLPRADLQNRLSRQGSAELKRLSHRLPRLELIGGVAPMLGLTGTVTGLTRAFRTVAALKPVTDPSLLASGIWEALITTIAGLFIGIPALIAYHLYDKHLRSLAFELKTPSEELVATLTERT